MQKSLIIIGILLLTLILPFFLAVAPNKPVSPSMETTTTGRTSPIKPKSKNIEPA